MFPVFILIAATRTLGVITKIDQAASEQKALAAVQALLLNQGPPKTSDIPWVALIGQSVSIASASGSSGSENSLETAWQAESESLKSILTGAPQNKLGRVAMVDALAGQIRSRMKLRLPNLLTGYLLSFGSSLKFELLVFPSVSFCMFSHDLLPFTFLAFNELKLFNNYKLDYNLSTQENRKCWNILKLFGN